MSRYHQADYLMHEVRSLSDFSQAGDFSASSSSISVDGKGDSRSLRRGRREERFVSWSRTPSNRASPELQHHRTRYSDGYSGVDEDESESLASTSDANSVRSGPTAPGQLLARDRDVGSSSIDATVAKWLNWGEKETHTGYARLTQQRLRQDQEADRMPRGAIQKQAKRFSEFKSEYVARHQRRRHALIRGLHRWYAHSMTRKVAEDMYIRSIADTMQRHLQFWAAKTQQNIERELAGAKVALKRAFIMGYQCLSAWRGMVARRKRFRCDIIMAANHWARQTIQRAIMAWRAYAYPNREWVFKLRDSYALNGRSGQGDERLTRAVAMDFLPTHHALMQRMVFALREWARDSSERRECGLPSRKQVRGMYNHALLRYAWLTIGNAVLRRRKFVRNYLKAAHKFAAAALRRGVRLLRNHMVLMQKRAQYRVAVLTEARREAWIDAAWGKWRAEVAIQEARRFAEMVDYHAFRMSFEGIRTWVANMMILKERLFVLEKAACHRDIAMMKHGFGLWRKHYMRRFLQEYISFWREWRRMHVLVDKKFFVQTVRSLRASMRRWQDMVYNRAEAYEMIDRWEMQIGIRAQKKFLKRWKVISRRRRGVLERWKRTMDQWDRKRLKQGLRKLGDLVYNRRKLRKKIMRILPRTERRSKVEALREWHGVVWRRNEKLSALSGLVFRWRHLELCSGFNSWKGHAGDAIRLRMLYRVASQYANKRLKGQRFLVWHGYHTDYKRIEVILVRLGFLGKGRCFRMWRSWCAEKIASGAAKALSSGHWRLRAIESAVWTWRGHIKQQRDRREVTRMAVKHLLLSLLGLAGVKGGKKAVRGKVDAVVSNRGLAGVLRAIIRWRQRAAQAQERRRMTRKALKHQRRIVLPRFWEYWVQMTRAMYLMRKCMWSSSHTMFRVWALISRRQVLQRRRVVQGVRTMRLRIRFSRWYKQHRKRIEERERAAMEARYKEEMNKENEWRKLATPKRREGNDLPAKLSPALKALMSPLSPLSPRSPKGTSSGNLGREILSSLGSKSPSLAVLKRRCDLNLMLLYLIHWRRLVRVIKKKYKILEQSYHKRSRLLLDMPIITPGRRRKEASRTPELTPEPIHTNPYIEERMKQGIPSPYFGTPGIRAADIYDDVTFARKEKLLKPLSNGDDMEGSGHKSPEQGGSPESQKPLYEEPRSDVAFGDILGTHISSRKTFHPVELPPSPNEQKRQRGLKLELIGSGVGAVRTVLVPGTSGDGTALKVAREMITQARSSPVLAPHSNGEDGNSTSSEDIENHIDELLSSEVASLHESLATTNPPRPYAFMQQLDLMSPFAAKEVNVGMMGSPRDPDVTEPSQRTALEQLVDADEKLLLVERIARSPSPSMSPDSKAALSMIKQHRFRDRSSSPRQDRPPVTSPRTQSESPPPRRNAAARSVSPPARRHKMGTVSPLTPKVPRFSKTPPLRSSTERGGADLSDDSSKFIKKTSAYHQWKQGWLLRRLQQERYSIAWQHWAYQHTKRCFRRWMYHTQHLYSFVRDFYSFFHRVKLKRMREGFAAIKKEGDLKTGLIRLLRSGKARSPSRRSDELLVSILLENDLMRTGGLSHTIVDTIARRKLQREAIQNWQSSVADKPPLPPRVPRIPDYYDLYWEGQAKWKGLRSFRTHAENSKKETWLHSSASAAANKTPSARPSPNNSSVSRGSRSVPNTPPSILRHGQTARKSVRRELRFASNV